MPAIPALTEPLSDGHIQLRAASGRDIPEILIAYEDDPQLHVRLGEDRPPSGAQLGTRAERAAAELAAGSCARLTILEPGSEDCCGQLTLRTIDWDHLRAELQLWVAPQLRRRGLARRALRLPAPWLFNDCGLMRITLLIEPDNEPMLRAARAAGFVEEGVLRGYTRERGTRVDRAVLSLLPEDVRR